MAITDYNLRELNRILRLADRIQRQLVRIATNMDVPSDARFARQMELVSERQWAERNRPSIIEALLITLHGLSCFLDHHPRFINIKHRVYFPRDDRPVLEHDGGQGYSVFELA